MEEMLLHISNGDTIKRIDDTVLIDFARQRKVLASSIYNGGYREDLQAVLNHHPQPSEQAMSVQGYYENMAKLCLKLGYDPKKVATMGTGVAMKDIVVKTEVYDELEVIVVATAGAEGNAGRVGDFADYSGKTEKQLPHGTINIMVYFNADVLPGTMARAIVTATEAKTAALQELMIGSMYSNGLATGTGTDQILIVADPQGKYLVDDCGKHTKPGEMVGRLVKAAVLEALYKRNGYNGQAMHTILRRVKRFGITETSLLEAYNKQCAQIISMQELQKALQFLNADGKSVMYTSLYVHLLDQYNWGLLKEEEVFLGCAQLLENENIVAQSDLTHTEVIAFLVDMLEKYYLLKLHEVLENEKN